MNTTNIIPTYRMELKSKIKIHKKRKNVRNFIVEDILCDFQLNITQLESLLRIKCLD